MNNLKYLIQNNNCKVVEKYNKKKINHIKYFQIIRLL